MIPIKNSPDDPRYRAFLSRLFIPLNERIAPESCGLDFGSGPGPTLSVMFEEQGHTMVCAKALGGGGLDRFVSSHICLDTLLDGGQADCQGQS